MKNEINDLSEKLTKLQLRRREVIEDLQRVEKEITTVLTKQQENERNDTPHAISSAEPHPPSIEVDSSSTKVTELEY